MSSAASGGSCGQGAASAVFGKYTTNSISGWGGDGTSGVIARGVATAVAGGVGSVIAGGKFANGAETAAFGYLFNQVLSSEEASRRAAARNNQVMQGKGCVGEAYRMCAGLPSNTEMSKEGKELVTDVGKLAASMHPAGRFVVGAVDGGSVVLDVATEDLKGAGTTASSMLVGAGVEKGLTHKGVPDSMAGRLGAVAGSAWERAVKFFND